MNQDVKDHVDKCKVCFELKPSKSEAVHKGLSVLLKDLSPMDWLSTDLCEMKLKDRKLHFIIIVDRASGLVTAYKLASTKTHHIVACLQQFV